MKIKHFMMMVACCVALSSCYFNSAGHIVNAGSYTAKVKTDKIQPGQVVYQKDGRYYAELARYRNDEKVITQYCFHEDKQREMDYSYQGKQLCEIPADYAQYITGQSGASVTPSFLRPVKDESAITESATKLPIVRVGAYQDKMFEYRSPNLPWLWTAAVFDWLCVDLPVTCVENGLFVVYGYCKVMNHLMEESRSSSGSSSSGGGLNSEIRAAEERNRQQQMEVQSLRDAGIM